MAQFRLYWGSPLTGAPVSKAITGSAVTVSAGTLIAAIAQGLSGSESSSAAGTVGQTVGQPITGSAVSGNAGTLISAVTQPLVGSESASAAGTLTPVTGGTDAALTGEQVTSSAGTLSPVLAQPIVGSSSAGTAGTVGNAVTQPLTGQAVTASAGTLTASVDNNVSVALGGTQIDVFTGTLGTLGGIAARSSTGAGRARKRRRQLSVEIDGKEYVVGSEEEAVALLDDARERAKQTAELAIERAVKATKRKPSKVLQDARRTLSAPNISAEGAVTDYAGSIMAEIDAMFKSAMQDIEIQSLMRKAERDMDDEDELLLMMV